MSRRTVRIGCVVLCMTISHSSPGSAQAPPPITPSGLATQVTLSSTPPTGTVQYDITGGTRAGTNLFHSFGDFNVPNDTIANFLNDTRLDTANILGRVTGNNASGIFGTIQTTGFENANLYLINPSGVVFGPNASLNVGGSVTFTTAEYLRLAETDGAAGIFRADSGLPSLLTSAPVTAFGFLGPNPRTLEVQGSTLTTTPGRSLSLVAGNITIDSGTLGNNVDQAGHPDTPAGRIDLVSVASPGEVAAKTLHYTPNINGQSFGALGAVKIVDGSVIDVGGNGGGTVLIRGGQFLLDDSRISSNVNGPGPIINGTESIGSGIDIVVSQDAYVQKVALIRVNVSDGTTPGVTYGGVHVTADRILITGIPGSAANFRSLRFTSIMSNTEGAGNAGNITLRATKNIETTNVVSVVSTSGFNSDGTDYSATLARGNAGNVELISEHGDILMMQGGRAAQATSQILNSTGDTGGIAVSARGGDVVLDGANIFTASFEGGGRVGPVEITARNLLMKAGLIDNENLGSSKPGGITVSLSNTLTMAADFSVPASIRANSLIATSAFNPTTNAPAGDITITAKDITATQGSLISSETFAAGAGGQLKIFTDTLQLKDGSQIKSGSTFAPKEFPQGIIPAGPGGNIAIRSLTGPTASVLIDGSGGGIFSDTVGHGAGGSVDLFARAITIQNGGTISAATTGTDARATGGSIEVKATDQVTMNNGASITANSTFDPKTPNSGIANAGNISIDAGQQLDVQDSSITTKAEKASGGNIDIKAVDLIRLANSPISSSVQGGPSTAGGNITIDPKTVVLQNAQILATAQQGNGGNITITTPVFLKDRTSRIDASSQFGVNGTVTIQSPTSNLSGTVTQLSSKADQTQPLLQNRCVALAGGEQSTFILAGRDILPSEPGGWLSSPVSMEHWMGEDTEHATGLIASTRKLNESRATITRVAQGEVLSLRRLTPPGFLVRTFAIGPTGCHS